MTTKLIDGNEIIAFLAKNPGATSFDIQKHVGATINGIRSKLQKMVIAGDVTVKRVGCANRYALVSQTTLQNQLLLNTLLRGVQQRRAAL